MHDVGSADLEVDVNTFRGDLKLATLDDLDSLHRLVTRSGLAVLDLLDDLVALEDLAEDDVTAIEPPVTEEVSIRRHRSGGCRVTDEVMTVVMKNWEPLVSLPALAMDSIPFLECLSLKFSSLNLLP